MAKTFSRTDIGKLEARFKTRWNAFRKALKTRAYKDLPVNDQAVFVHWAGKKKNMIHGRAKIVAYIQKNMPGLSLAQTDETLPTPAKIMTESYEIGLQPVRAYITHDAMKVTTGTYRYNPDGEYSMVWVHQDECFWELIAADFREGR
jgi:hypothetical protein